MNWTKSLELVKQYGDVKGDAVRSVLLQAGIDPEDMPELVHKDELAGFAKRKGLQVYNSGEHYVLHKYARVIVLHKYNDNWSEATLCKASEINKDKVVLVIVV
jgi:hypothetical protein